MCRRATGSKHSVIRAWDDHMNNRDRLTGNSYWRNIGSDRASDAPWTFTQKLKPRTIFIDTTPCCAAINCSIRNTRGPWERLYTPFVGMSSCFLFHLSLNLMLSNEKYWCLSTELTVVDLNAALEKSETKIDNLFLSSS